MNESIINLIKDYFEKNHLYMYEVAKNCLKKIKRPDLAPELVSECYLHLIDDADKKKHKFEAGMIESMAVQFMHKSCIWSKTPFKKKYIIKDTSPNSDKIEAFLQALDTDLSDDDVLQKEFEHQAKTNLIYANLASLPVDQKNLYDIIFNRGINSSSKLAKYLGTSRSSAYTLIRNLKDQLKKQND